MTRFLARYRNSLLVSGIALFAISPFAARAWWDLCNRPSKWQNVDLDRLSDTDRQQMVFALGFPCNADGALARFQNGELQEARIKRAIGFSINECRDNESEVVDQGRPLITTRSEWTTIPPAEWRSMVDALEEEWKARSGEFPCLVSLEWKQISPGLREFTLIWRGDELSLRSKYRAGANLESVVPVEYARCSLRADAFEQLAAIVRALGWSGFAVLGATVAFIAMRPPPGKRAQ
ncbi:hypothetical protein ANRL2_03176 [Anaerolineae bacterium]|nr:hypothetical protein ANRL2_03176 [Anaerolineae bacterium]